MRYRPVTLFTTAMLIFFGSLTAAVYAQDPEVTREPQPDDDLIAAITAENSPEIYTYPPSPDFRWSVELTIYGCTSIPVQANETELRGYEILTLKDAAGYDPIVIDEQITYCGERIGAEGVGFLKWSPDSRYLYYTNGRQGVPGGEGVWWPPAIRLDLQTMQSEYLGAATFSMNSRYLATIATDNRVITLYDSTQPEPLASFEPLINPGIYTDLFWLTDNSGLISIEADSYVTSHLILSHIDLASLSRNILIENDLLEKLKSPAS